MGRSRNSGEQWAPCLPLRPDPQRSVLREQPRALRRRGHRRQHRLLGPGQHHGRLHHHRWRHLPSHSARPLCRRCSSRVAAADATMAYVAHLHPWTHFPGSNPSHLLVPVRWRRSSSRAAYTKLVLKLELLLMELLLQWHDKLMTIRHNNYNTIYTPTGGQEIRVVYGLSYSVLLSFCSCT